MGSIGDSGGAWSAAPAGSNRAPIGSGSGPYAHIRGVARMREGHAASRGDQAGNAVGSPSAGPRRTSRKRAASATVVASKPSVEKSIHEGIGSPPSGPLVGFRPTSPQKAAGIRIEPPPSVPVASGASPGSDRRTAAAARASRGPVGGPGTLRRAEEAVRRESLERELGQVGLPDDDGAGGPESCDRVAVAPAGEASPKSRDPKVVGRPAPSSLSFTRRGSPASGPGSAPAATRASVAAASANARVAR